MNNESNSNQRGAMHGIELAGKVVLNAFEMWVLLEILWWYLHDGEQTFREALADFAERCRERALHRAEVQETRRIIRDLPETE